MKRRIRYIVLVVIILLLTFLGLLFCQSKREERRAALFVSEMSKIEPGVSTFQDLSRLSSQFEANRDNLVQLCDKQACQVSFTFENRPLVRLHLAPFTHLAGWVKVENDKVVNLGLAYRVDEERELSSSATVLEFPASPDRKGFVVTKSDVAGGKPPFTVVRLSSDATARQRAIAFDFDLSCLSRLRGCADAKVLSPSVWNLSGSD
jgi:hypothetical protein